MTCDTCRWFDASKHGKWHDGRCVKRPPIVVADTRIQANVTVWPDVMKGDRCGEWTDPITVTSVRRRGVSRG